MTYLQSRPSWRAVLGVFGVGVACCLGLAACSTPAAAPPAPQAASTVDLNQAWDVLSQSSRLAQLTPEAPLAAAGPKIMSPDEARAAAPFAFGLPAWVPPGFELQPQAEVIAPTAKAGFASVSLNWQNAQGGAIELLISQGEAGLALAGAGSEAVQIGGQPASLQQQSGLGADRLTLSWARGSLTYRLATDAGAATRAELVRMAESVS